MIVSVHIPKTAGMSLRADLAHVFGERLFADYADWPESTAPESVAHNERNRAAMLADADAIGERYDAIHGHFLARKYAGVFPVTALVTMVRDPYQHAISTYEHATRDSASAHPDHRAFKEAQMTIVELVDAFPNHQALYLGGVPLEDFAMIGVTEQYERSIALFEAIFRIPMPRATVRQNVNPVKHGAEYDVGPEVRCAVERSRAEDIALYRRACERFAKLCFTYGV